MIFFGYRIQRTCYLVDVHLVFQKALGLVEQIQYFYSRQRVIGSKNEGFHMRYDVSYFHKLLCIYPSNAAAPLTISVNSVVIAAWRALLYEIRRLRKRSSALSVALSIEVILAPCSDALASSMAL